MIKLILQNLLELLKSSKIFNPNIRTLQVGIKGTNLSLPVIQLGSQDQIKVSFDEMSHNENKRLIQLGYEPMDPSKHLSYNPIHQYDEDVVFVLDDLLPAPFDDFEKTDCGGKIRTDESASIKHPGAASAVITIASIILSIRRFVVCFCAA